MEIKRTTYISQRVWREIEPGLRRAIMRVTGLRRSEIVSTNKFVANLEDMLRARGENRLADMLVAEDLK